MTDEKPEPTEDKIRRQIAGLQADPDGVRKLTDAIDSKSDVYQQIAHLLAGDIANHVKTAYPDIDPKDALTKYIIPALLEIPEWANANGGPQVGMGTIFNSGTFAVYFGKDPDSGEIVTLLHTRKETKENGENKVGAVGGYVTQPEQPVDGLVRETAEEIISSDGKPIFTPDAAKYVLMDAAFDFREGSEKIPVQYIAYAYEMSPEEIRSIKNYTENFKDKEFKDAVVNASDGETHGFDILPLEDVVKMKPDDFTYHRHYDVYREVASRLELEVEGLLQRRKTTEIGYPIDRNTELSVTRSTFANGIKTRFTPGGVEKSEGKPPSAEGQSR